MTPAASFPVAILMERKVISRSGWSLPHWQAVGVVAGEQFAGWHRGKELVHEADGVQQFMWRGFSLDLYRDAAEHYWFNLSGEQPVLFIICQKAADEELVPSMVSADFGDAESAVERDGAAFSVPIPPAIYLEIERFVLQHYEPAPPRRRKREDWRDTER